MGGISLTASMRSNLLSLQNISGQVSSTQNKLATGNKVNSAIDNPSSYYTALSLNNRADDLNALLDSMGQAVSTIKAATTALESAADFLEQASAVATQALETAKVPAKSFFEEKVGENGAVVTTAQELRKAIEDNKDIICVYGAIDLDNISTTGGLELKENQKLVGVGYFGNYDTDTNKFSCLSATANAADKNLIDITKNGCLVSDLSLNYGNTIAVGNAFVIKTEGANVVSKLQNLEIVAKFSEDSSNTAMRGAIASWQGSTANIGKNINILVSGRYGCGIVNYINSVTNIQHSTSFNIFTSGYGGYGAYNYKGSILNIQLKSSINIVTSGQAHGIYNCFDSTNNIYGDVSITGGNVCGIANSLNSGNNINIGSSARIYLNVNSYGLHNGYNGGSGINILDISTGAKLAFEKDGKTDWYEVKKDWQDKNTSTTTANTISADDVKDKLNVEETSAWDLPKKIEEDKKDNCQDLESNSKQYQEIINQYDSLIKDASYKGINLLQNDKLSVKFNEDNTASLNVEGKDMSSKALGFTVFDWQTQGDIADSLAEIASALKSIRNYSAELGNNYSIITTRQDFTNSLINVLTEGADKLTLADMNEESANMLALQTRQQLAINSLSLASQASQSILKLF